MTLKMEMLLADIMTKIMIGTDGESALNDPKWTNISDLFTLRYPNMVSWEIPELNGGNMVPELHGGSIQ
jgi:hypothetical protein